MGTIIIDFLKSISPKEVVISVFSACAGFIGSYLLSKKQQKAKIKERHFKKLKDEILEPWLNKLQLEAKRARYDLSHMTQNWMHTQERFERVNKELLNDLYFHFPKIKESKIEIEKEEDKLENKLDEAEQLLKKKYPPDRNSLGHFLIEGNGKICNLYTDYGGVMYGNQRIVYCNSNFFEDVIKELNALYENKIGKSIRIMYQKLLDKIDRLKTEIEKALALENLQFKCNFIK